MSRSAAPPDGGEKQRAEIRREAEAEAVRVDDHRQIEVLASERDERARQPDAAGDADRRRHERQPQQFAAQDVGALERTEAEHAQRRQIARPVAQRDAPDVVREPNAIAAANPR